MNDFTILAVSSEEIKMWRSAEAEMIKASLQITLIDGEIAGNAETALRVQKKSDLTLDKPLYMLYIENNPLNATKFLFCCVRCVGGAELEC